MGAALAGMAGAATAKWHTLLGLVSKHPVSLGAQGIYTYADVVDATSNLGRVDQWQSNAVLLQQLWTAAAGGKPIPSPAPSSSPTATPSPSSSPGYYSGIEQQLAIVCADSPNPRDLAAYSAAAAVDTFAPTAAWNSFGCANWPAAAAQDRYTGPWNRPTASTILVVGNTGDPWTAYHDSVAMSRELARARLLTVDGYGHTSGENPSACAITTSSATPSPAPCPRPELSASRTPPRSRSSRFQAYWRVKTAWTVTVLFSDAMRSGLYVRPKSPRLTGISASSWISPAVAETLASRARGRVRPRTVRLPVTRATPPAGCTPSTV